MFLLNILEAVLAYDLVNIRFIKEKQAILNGNTNDKSRGIQLIGPGYLQKIIKGVNWPLSPIGILCFYHRSSMEIKLFLTSIFFASVWKMYSYYRFYCTRKCFVLIILKLWPHMTVFKLVCIKKKEAILKSDTNDKTRGIQSIAIFTENTQGS